ncbi:hypothetical protein ml_33 [Mollivirus sibericum]|uniref:hypothetical protein n=1 Tax=Mollivirus sibericum TaxID=1678078 RepID=UPI0006B2E4FF|nr:hypothetical protein ml_33 [Mollivirus sibericum]ALD61835.1 hypothetical protein ml_33 [Mollivirus sibericum]
MAGLQESGSQAPRSLFHQAVATAFKHGGDDLSVLEFPFRLAFSDSRLRERPLPLVNYDDSLLLADDADDEDAGLDSALCRFIDLVGADVDARGLVAQVKEGCIDRMIPLARGTFSIHPSTSTSSADVITVSPGTWHDSPSRSNACGSRGWLRSFRRSERLASEVWRRLNDKDDNRGLPNEMLLTRLFQHLFREAVVSRHGAALQSALAMYERALAMYMESDKICICLGGYRDDVDNLWTVPPPGGDDYDVADRMIFADWSVGCHTSMRLYNTTPFTLKAGRNFDHPAHGEVLATAGHWLMQVAVWQEDPLALVVMEAMLSRRHVAFGASPLKHERLYFGRVDDAVFGQVAQAVGHPSMSLARLEQAWMIAQAMLWFRHPLRDCMWNPGKLPYQMLCDEDDKANQRFYDGLDLSKDSMRMDWHERLRANFAVFAKRSREQKADFYDRLDAWLSDEVLDFLDKASDHIRKMDVDSCGTNTERKNSIEELRRFIDAVTTLAADTLDLLAASVGLPVVVMLQYASRVSANMEDKDSPLCRAIQWLGLSPGQGLLESRHPLVSSFATSSAYTLERQARLCFRLAGARSIYVKSGAGYHVGLVALVHPKMTLDPRNRKAVCNISRDIHGLSLRAGFCMQFNHRCGSRKPSANERLWRDTILPDVTRNFMRHVFLAVDADPGLASRIDFRMSPHDDCDVKLREALRAFAFGSDNFSPLLNAVSRSPKLCKCQAVEAL